MNLNIFNAIQSILYYYSHSPHSAFIPLSVTRPARTPPVTPSANTSLTPSTPNQPITTTTPQAPIRVPTIRISSAASSSKAPATAGSSSASDPNGMSDLQRFLAEMQASADAPQINVDLSSVITADVALQFLSDRDHTNALLPYIPHVEADEDAKVQLMNTMLSPQFKAALSSFSSAFLSGQLGPVLTPFNLSIEAYAAVNFGNLEAFIRSLERSAIRAASTIELIRTEEDDDEDMEDDS